LVSLELLDTGTGISGTAGTGVDVDGGVDGGGTADVWGGGTADDGDGTAVDEVVGEAASASASGDAFGFFFFFFFDFFACPVSEVDVAVSGAVDGDAETWVRDFNRSLEEGSDSWLRVGTTCFSNLRRLVMVVES
jgi:hypothetical protein